MMGGCEEEEGMAHCACWDLCGDGFTIGCCCPGGEEASAQEKDGLEMHFFLFVILAFYILCFGSSGGVV